MGTKIWSIRNTLLPKIIAAFFVLSGISIIPADLLATWRMLTGEDDFSFFIVLFIIITIIFAIYLIRLGIEVWSTITANILRQISIIFTLLVCVWVHSYIPESVIRSETQLYHAISMASAGLLYLIINRLLFKLFKTQRTEISSGLKSF